MRTKSRKIEELIGRVTRIRAKQRVKLLRLLSDLSLTPKQIAKEMGYSSPKAVYTAISRAKKRGHITHDSKPTMRKLTGAGQDYIKAFLNFRVHTHKIEEQSIIKGHTKLKNELRTIKPDILRHHAVQFSITPIGCINWPATRHISEVQIKKYGISSYKTWKKGKANIGDFWISNVRIQTNNRGIEVFIPDSYYEDARLMLDRAYSQLLDVLPMIERLFKTTFHKPNRLNIKLSKQEVAVLNNELAYALKEKGIRKMFVYDEAGKAWAKFDYSEGPPEFEFIDTKQAEWDTQRFKDLCNDIRKDSTFLPGEASHLIRELKILSEAVIELSTNLAKLSMTNKKDIKEINDKLKQPAIPEVRGVMYG